MITTRHIAAAATLLATATAFTQDVSISPIVEPPPSEARVINLAICLDTSGSMSGLIDAARQKIWDIVNDLALAEPTPDLRVALLTYGSPAYGAETGWVQVCTPFTEDLDLVSQRLFELTTSGGDEYVGRVLHAADSDLQWHPSDDALKLIVVAGNESADQDPEIPFRDACRAAIGNGIMVNAIYCGNPMSGDAPGWREVASLADGQFASIDQDNGTIVITTPFDDQLTALSAEINKTYIAFTAEGQIAAANQQAQDANASGMNSAAAASRAQTKGGALYRNSWDLVEATKAEDFKLEDVKDEDLPEAMRGMTLDERKAYIQSMADQRAAIQQEITALGQQRQAFIAEEMKKQAVDQSKAFGQVLRAAVREQARQKGYQFEEPETEPEQPETTEPEADGQSEQEG
jgi:hypothetical protein